MGLKAERISQHRKIRITIENTGIRTFLNALKTRTNPRNPERITALTHPAAQPLLIAPLCELRAHSSPQQHRRDLFMIYSYISVVCGQQWAQDNLPYHNFPHFRAYCLRSILGRCQIKQISQKCVKKQDKYPDFT